ncbi:MAG: LamG-like jellyroll fold domain-containing protein [Saprospiraceae bacterium]|nr:T9SS type A sorting domain-containing protein [Saprospiraceae bacterium]MDW8228230.1 LamG-like jellyroll fold domain-containing protein [Saprospiraceae bacterium]
MRSLWFRLWMGVLLGWAHLVAAQEYSLRFYGHGPNDIDRVKIPIDNPHRPVDVSHNFTIEFWMRALPGENTANVCAANQWYFANIMIDRDIFGDGDYGDYGIALGNRRIVVGVQVGNNATTGVCGNTIVDDGVWRHIAITRNASNGQVRLFVNGVQDAVGPTGSNTGNISYRDGRSTSYPNSDPFLVLGAEKHDYPGSLYYSGWLDEMRISNIIRYTANFTPPSAPFTTDANTVGLYHFNEGSGTTLTDVSGASGGPSNGTLMVGGNPPGPAWSTSSPFSPPMPVELDALTAFRMPTGEVQLQWKTYTETNTARFVVQRSTDGLQRWDDIGHIPARGHSRQVQRYTFTDAAPPASPRLHYRLRVEDFDETLQFSPAVALHTFEEALYVFPNPFADRFHVRTALVGRWQATLFDALGRVVLTHTSEQETDTLYPDALPPGLYTLVVEQGGFRRVQRLSKR